MGRVLFWTTLWLLWGVGQTGLTAAAQTSDSISIWHDRAPLESETNLFILKTQPLHQPDLQLNAHLQELDLISTPPVRLNPGNFGSSEGPSEQQAMVVTSAASPSGFTEPSFWWTQDQIGRRLVENWGAANDLVDVFVNPQIWSLLTYAERYAFINQFATTARSYGYNLRVYDRQPSLLATYICGVRSEPMRTETFNGDTLGINAPAANCRVCLDGRGNCGLTVLFRPVVGLPARVPDTADN